MVKFFSFFLVGALSTVGAYAQLSDNKIDQVLELLMDEDYISGYLAGDDGEDCFSDIDLHSAEQLKSKEWHVEFDILHLEKHGCVYWTSINCEARLNEDLSKVLDSSCSY